jgi:hypothetical protein
MRWHYYVKCSSFVQFYLHHSSKQSLGTLMYLTQLGMSLKFHHGRTQALLFTHIHEQWFSTLSLLSNWLLSKCWSNIFTSITDVLPKHVTIITDIQSITFKLSTIFWHDALSIYHHHKPLSVGGEFYRGALSFVHQDQVTTQTSLQDQVSNVDAVPYLLMP